MKKNKERYNKKIKVITYLTNCSLIVISIFSYKYFTSFNINKEINQVENVELAIYLGEEKTKSIPSKDSGYYYDLEKSSCTNGAYINWDSVSWSPVVKNVTTYPTKCDIHFTKTYTEGILNGADPIIKDELIPVTIDSDGTVKKANLETPWYSYADKNWANAVITRNSYDVLNIEGKVHGATKEENEVYFDGIDDYIDLGLENYDFGNQITIKLQVKINSIEDNTSNHMLITNFESAGFSIEYTKDGIVGSFQRSDYTYKKTKSFKYNLNQYYNIILKYNGSKIDFYIDGNLIDSTEYNENIMPSVKGLHLGTNPNINKENTQYGNISFKDVVIYNRAITDEEVRSLNEGKIPNTEGLLKYVDFTNKTNYEANEVIPEEIIESYFVWIPKYRYQLWDLGLYEGLTEIDINKVHEIPIIFGDYDTSDEKDGECTTPMESGETGNCQVGDYMTHPAFQSIPSTGFWVGKFETGTTLTSDYNARNGEAIQIKPNVISWQNIQLANAFYTSYDYKRNLDSHIIKNTEWGAIAYLQYSIYGSQENVRINNNTSNITGYAANNEPTCGYTGTNEECNRFCNDGTCNTAYPNSVLASTTSNITGIYDMAGGTWEYVMGVMLDESGKPMSGRSSLKNSGFNGSFGCPECDGDTSGLTELTTGYNWPEQKYYDTYPYSSTQVNYQRRILGDATAETGPFEVSDYNKIKHSISGWYKNMAKMPSNSVPIVMRGCSHGDGNYAGMFAFYAEFGNSNGRTYRIVLTPQ